MADRSMQWRWRMRQTLIEKFGGRCAHCGLDQDLEFAHTEPTGLKGPSRGSFYRVRDIMLHPQCYLLLCMTCHDLFDGRRPRRRQPEIRHELYD